MSALVELAYAGYEIRLVEDRRVKGAGSGEGSGYGFGYGCRAGSGYGIGRGSGEGCCHGHSCWGNGYGDGNGWGSVWEDSGTGEGFRCVSGFKRKFYEYEVHFCSPLT